jgi:methyl-accepting chemotaxis protein
MLFTIGLLALISMMLTGNLNSLVDTVRQAAQGDLSVRAKVSGRSEMAQAALALNDMLANLQRLEAELRESETHFRDLVEGSIQGIAIVQDGTLAFANSACAAMFGFASTEALLRVASIEELVTPEERERRAARRRTATRWSA